MVNDDDRLERIRQRVRDRSLGVLDVEWLISEHVRLTAECIYFRSDAPLLAAEQHVEKLQNTLKLAANSLMDALELLATVINERDALMTQIERPSPN